MNVDAGFLSAAGAAAFFSMTAVESVMAVFSSSAAGGDGFSRFFAAAGVGAVGVACVFLPAVGLSFTVAGAFSCSAAEEAAALPAAARLVVPGFPAGAGGSSMVAELMVCRGMRTGEKVKK